MQLNNKIKAISVKHFALIGAVLLFGIFDTINMYKIPSVYETLASTFQLGSHDVATIMAVYSITASLMAIPAGFLADRFGSKKIITIGVFVSAFGAILGVVTFHFFNGNPSLLCVSRILEGLCYIFSSVCMPIFLRRITGVNGAGFAIGI